MDEQKWAFLGRVLATVGTLTAVAAGTMQINDKLSRPSIFGTTEYLRCAVPPEVLETLRRSVDIKSLTEIISTNRQSKKSSEQILKLLEARLSAEDDEPSSHLREMRASLTHAVVRFTIMNSGSAVAHEVRLVIPGKGEADISEPGTVNRPVQHIHWSDNVPVGDVRPGGVVEVATWLGDAYIANTEILKPALVHSEGSGRLYELQGFYGRDADLVEWFITQSAFLRWGTLVLISLLLLLVSRWAIRRGYLVLQPSPRTRLAK